MSSVLSRPDFADLCLVAGVSRASSVLSYPAHDDDEAVMNGAPGGFLLRRDAVIGLGGSES